MAEALEASGAGVVASYSLAGGVLTGKYDGGGSGRASAEFDSPRFAEAREAGRALRALADEVGGARPRWRSASRSRNPAVASVLFGATSPAQIAENVRALDLDRELIERVRALAV